MIVNQLKKSILSSAFRGKLINSSNIINQYSEESRKEELGNLQKLEKITIKKFDKIIQNDEIPYPIPDNWIWVRLGALTYNWGQKKPDVDFEYIDISSIDNINQKLSNVSNIVEYNKAPSRARKILKKGDIIYSTVRPYLHNIAIIDKDFEKEPIASTGFAVLHTMKFLNNKFLFYYLLSPEFDMYANSSENAVGIAYPAINDEKLYNGLVPLPPIEDQQRIVDKIEKLFDKLSEIKPLEGELNELKISFPNAMKNSILLYAIKGNLTFQNESEIINTDLIFDIQKVKHPFDIPKNWMWCSHNDLFEIIGGSQPPKSKFSNTCEDGYVQLYQTRDYGPNPQPIFVNKADVSKFSKKGDIILARYGGSLGKVFWAEDGAYNVALAKVIIKYPELINKKYLYYYYFSDLYQSKVKKGNRSAQSGFSKEDLNDLPFPLPPIEEQQRIVDKIEQLLSLCNDIESLV